MFYFHLKVWRQIFWTVDIRVSFQKKAAVTWYNNSKSMRRGEGCTEWNVSLLTENKTSAAAWPSSVETVEGQTHFVSLWTRSGLHHLIIQKEVGKTCSILRKLQNPWGKQKLPPWWPCTQWETSFLFLSWLTDACGCLAAAQWSEIQLCLYINTEKTGFPKLLFLSCPRSFWCPTASPCGAYLRPRTERAGEEPSSNNSEGINYFKKEENRGRDGGKR